MACRRLFSPGVKVLIARAMFLAIQYGAFKSYGVLLEATAQDLPHSLVSVAFSIPGSLVFLIAPLSKKLLDTFPLRHVCVVGGFITGAGYIFSACLETTATNLIIGCSITGVGFGLQLYPIVLCIAEHYGEEFKRYQAIPLSFMFFGMSVLPVLFEELMERYGQKGATLVFGGLLFHSIIPGIIISRGPHKEEKQTVDYDTQPSSNDQESDSESASLFQNDKISRKSQPRWLSLFYCHPKVILVLYVYGCAMFIYGGWSIFLVPFAQRKGYELSTAVYLSAFGGLGGWLGEVFTTYLLFSGCTLWFLYVIPCSIGAAFLFSAIFYFKFLYLAAAAFISGICQGVLQCVVDVSVQESVCKNHFPYALTWSYFVGAPSTLFVGILGGLTRDDTGNYDFIFNILSGTFASVVFAALIMEFCFENSKNECQS